MLAHRTGFPILVLLLAACSGDCSGDCSSGTDGGGGGDAGARDAGRDAGRPDAGEADAGEADAGMDGGREVEDAGPGDAGAMGDAGCTVGEAASLATPGELDLFGTPSYFNEGMPLPAGRYRVRYVDGCMKYGSGQGWTVNAYAMDYACWYVIGATTSDRFVVPPGNVGYTAGGGGHAAFEDCVTASAAAPPVEFELTAPSPVGVWLLDSPYSDNMAGEGGRNPRWALDVVSAACGGGDGGT